MDHRVVNQIARLDSETTRLLAHLRTLTAAELAARDQGKGWSVLEVLNHVYLSEKLSFGALRRNLTHAQQQPPISLDTWWRGLALTIGLRMPVKTRAPVAVDMRSGQPVLDIDALENAWLAHRKDLFTELEASERLWSGKAIYRHPKAGRLSVPQMLDFFIEHQRHHARQITRILRSAQVNAGC